MERCTSWNAVTVLCGYAEPPNSCSANLYMNGAHSVEWRADDEALFAGAPQKLSIVSVLLGANRSFELRETKSRRVAWNNDIRSGDLCVMEGACQQFYKDRVPTASWQSWGPHINLRPDDSAEARRRPADTLLCTRNGPLSDFSSPRLASAGSRRRGHQTPGGLPPCCGS